MSLILKGIDLPTNGETLIVGIYGDENVSIEYSKPLVLAIEPNVQAIQIPKNHGRIGDLDELQKAIKTDIMGGLNYKHFIRNAPVILEVEGEK